MELIYLNNKIAKYKIQYNYEYINEYKSVKEASELTKTLGSEIIKVCKNKAKSANGFYWLYK